MRGIAGACSRRIVLPLVAMFVSCNLGVSDHDGQSGVSPIAHPQAAEVWESGSTRFIEWSEIDFDSARIEYSSDGNNWKPVSDTAVKAGDAGWQRFPWLVPQDSSTHCRIRIFQDSSKEHFVSEQFTIVALQIMSPLTGETWEVGSTQHIRWQSEYYDNVVIECSRDNGKSWEMIGNGAIRLSDPSWSDVAWTVDGEPSDSCKIRLHEYMEPSYFYVSGAFAIVGAGSR